MPRASTYRLTTDLEAAHAGGPVVCLASQALGQSFRLHTERPRYDAERDLVRRADAVGPSGVPLNIPPAGAPTLARVYITGPLMSSCGWVEGPAPCSGGFCDGYGGEGGVTERMCAALADGDVQVIVDSPGGACIGLPECVATILRAKAAMGRRIYVNVVGWCGSAAYWIAASIADPGEFYITISSMAGSIGARSAHANEAGALAMAGIEITDFAFPPGKIAQSPNRAPTAVGIARGERDVMAAFEAFAAAVGAARPPLTREAIVQLDADLLTGLAAKAAGLVDDVAGVEDVEAWALARAAQGDQIMADTEGAPTKPGAEEPAPPSKTDPPPPPKDSGCRKCGVAMPKENRYCGSCGTTRMEEEEEPPASEDAKTQARADKSVAALYAGMSTPALRAAAVSSHRALDAVARLVGAKTHGEIVGAVDATCADASKAKRYREERNAARTKADAQERMDLLARLYTHDPAGHPRGKLIVDTVEDTRDTQGRVTGSRITGQRPAALWSDGPEGRTLANLRGYVRSTLGDGTAPPVATSPAAERTPFDPPADPDPKTAADRPLDAEIEAARRDPIVVLAARTSSASLDDLARNHVLARRASRAQMVPVQ